MRITSKELARICGVSIGTVNRALNDRPGVNANTRERILRVSREVGYRPHLVARSLKTGKTSTVGITVYDLDNRFFAQLVNALERIARDSGYFVYLTLSNHDLENERACLERLAGLNVDGILIVPTNRGQEFVQFVRGLNMPVVTVGNRISKSIPFVGIRDREAMRDAVAFVASKGYQRIIYVSPPLSYRGEENIYEVEERLTGFREGVKAYSLQELVLRDKHFAEPLSKAIRESSLRTAIMCSSDIYALQALACVDSMGLRVPQDVGLVGFDDIDILSYVKPALTTISYPIEELSRQAFALLRRLMNGEQDVPAPALVQPLLVSRDSL